MNRRQTNQWSSVVLGVVLSSVAMLIPVASAQMDGWFITPEEASMASVADADPLRGGMHVEMGRADLDIGPLIEVQKPVAGSPLNAPIEIRVTFKSRSHPIDLSSLEVELVKFINIDITDRVVDYTTVQGIQLKEANIPSGSHQIRITLADSTGATSTQDFLFEVL